LQTRQYLVYVILQAIMLPQFVILLSFTKTPHMSRGKSSINLAGRAGEAGEKSSCSPVSPVLHARNKSQGA
jgi:hypothetical protein